MAAIELSHLYPTASLLIKVHELTPQPRCRSIALLAAIRRSRSFPRDSFLSTTYPDAAAAAGQLRSMILLIHEESIVRRGDGMTQR